MADVTREEMAASLRAVSAETDTKIVRMEGKMDLVLSKLEDISTRFVEMRGDVNARMAEIRHDGRATRANIWVAVGVIIAAIVALYLVFPVAVDLGMKMTEKIHETVKAATGK